MERRHRDARFDSGRTCIARGYRCAGITDHSYELAIARGMSMEQIARQQTEIDGLNARHAGSFRLFKGMEVNIRHYELAARALGQGCVFALDSDAHALARLAGIPERAIVND